MVMSPRCTKPASYSAQLVTRHLALCFGCTREFMLQGSVRRHLEREQMGLRVLARAELCTNAVAANIGALYSARIAQNPRRMTTAR